MKGLLRTFPDSSSIARLWAFVFMFVMAVGPSTNGEELKKAHVSQVMQDVKLLGSNAAPRPAAVNDSVDEGTAVRTGSDSRTELTFSDLTITRLGENTIFSYRAGTRELDLSGGAVLVEVPPRGAAIKINTAAVTAAITGGTALFSKGPPSKFMVLEGTGTFYPARHPEEAVTIHGGEMVMMTKDGKITRPTKFNVQLVLETSPLINDFPDLANLPLILAVIEEQAAPSEGPPSPASKDIIGAVTAGGARSVAEASPEQFLLAFNSIVVRGKERDLAMDVAAGVQLRPDLAERIVTSVLEIGRLDGKPVPKPLSCELIARIIRAAVGAAPQAAPAIVRAVVRAEPEARNCIIAAAIAAAPDQEFAIRAAAGDAATAALVQWHQTGTINPADNFGNVNSPEKPPAIP